MPTAVSFDLARIPALLAGCHIRRERQIRIGIEEKIVIVTRAGNGIALGERKAWRPPRFRFEEDSTNAVQRRGCTAPSFLEGSFTRSYARLLRCFFQAADDELRTIARQDSLCCGLSLAIVDLFFFLRPLCRQFLILRRDH